MKYSRGTKVLDIPIRHKVVTRSDGALIRAIRTFYKCVSEAGQILAGVTPVATGITYWDEGKLVMITTGRSDDA
jgi:predicted neuraminidase